MDDAAPVSSCDPSMIEGFLQNTLQKTEEQRFTCHLNECRRCRDLLERSAGDATAWKELADVLKDSSHDSVSLSSNAGFPEESPEVSLQIRNVLGILAPTDAPSMPGRLGTYEVSGVIGSGGMGVVLKAHDSSLDRVVAIKVLAPHLASSGAARKRFAREAKAAAAVLHPNVIAIHGVSNDADLPYLVMPYVRGQSLQRRLEQDAPLTTSETLRIGQQIAAGLAAAHAQGLVHRDIKPANIMLEEGVERVTITDFGLARAVDDATMTRSGVIAGTPQYMSPEQARGEPIDARSDLFSLGSVLFAMCTGRSPFRAGTSYGVLHRITHDTPRPVHEINSEVPSWFSRLIERFHAKQPDERIQTASQAEQLLLECIAYMEQPDKQPLPADLERSRRRTSSLRWIIATAAVACAFVFSMMLRVVDHGQDFPTNLDRTASELSTDSSERSSTLDATNDTMWNDPFQPNPSQVKAIATRLAIQTQVAFSKQPLNKGPDR